MFNPLNANEWISHSHTHAHTIYYLQIRISFVFSGISELKLSLYWFKISNKKFDLEVKRFLDFTIVRYSKNRNTNCWSRTCSQPQIESTTVRNGGQSIGTYNYEENKPEPPLQVFETE
jgi:hypothetical protein